MSGLERLYQFYFKI